MNKWNGKRFSIYDKEEKQVLGLINKLGEQTNYNTDEVERLTISDNKKVSHEEMKSKYKIDENADFTGSWFGIKRPTQSNEGLASTVEQIIDETIPNIKNQLDGIVIKRINLDKQYPKLQGEIDDTERIKRALLNTNCIIDFGNLSYNISGEIVVKDNTSLINGFLYPTNNKGRITLYGQNIKIKDFTIDSKGYAVGWGNIYLVNTNNTLIENVNILGKNDGYGIYCNTKAINTFLKNVNIPYVGFGLLFNDMNVSERIYDSVNYSDQPIGYGLYVYNCNFGVIDKTFGGDGIEINTPKMGFKDITINNCVINKAINSNPSVGMGFGFANCENVKITNNTIRNTLGSGAIHFELGKNFFVTNNTIEESYRGISLENLSNCFIKENYIKGCGQSIVNLTDTSISHITIKDNYISETKEYAIFLNNIQYSTIENNTIDKYNGLANTSIISIGKYGVKDATMNDIRNNKIIKGTTTITSNVISIYGSSNVCEYNQFIGYGAETLPTQFWGVDNRIVNYIRGNGRIGGLVYSHGDPTGYFNGREGDLAIDIVNGAIYRCSGGNTWVKKL